MANPTATTNFSFGHQRHSTGSLRRQPTTHLDSNLTALLQPLQQPEQDMTTLPPSKQRHRSGFRTWSLSQKHHQQRKPLLRGDIQLDISNGALYLVVSSSSSSSSPPIKIAASTTITIPPRRHHLDLQEQQRHLMLGQYAKSVQPHIITQYPPPPLKYASVEPATDSDRSYTSIDDTLLDTATAPTTITKKQQSSLKRQQHSHHHRISLPLFRITECTNDIPSPPCQQQQRRRRSSELETYHHQLVDTHGSVSTWTRKARGLSCWLKCYPMNTSATKVTETVVRKKGKHHAPQYKDVATQTLLTAT